MKRVFIVAGAGRLALASAICLWLGSALSLGSGCSSNAQPAGADLGPSGTLRLTLNAATQISGISFYTMKLVVSGQTSAVQIGAPQPTLPPSQTLDIDLHNDQGTISVTIEADDATGNALATGTGTVQVQEGQTADLSISLQPV